MKVVIKRYHYGPESIFPSQKTVDQNTDTGSRTGINVWMKKRIFMNFSCEVVIKIVYSVALFQQLQERFPVGMKWNIEYCSPLSHAEIMSFNNSASRFTPVTSRFPEDCEGIIDWVRIFHQHPRWRRQCKAWMENLLINWWKWFEQSRRQKKGERQTQQQNPVQETEPPNWLSMNWDGWSLMDVLFLMKLSLLLF